MIGESIGNYRIVAKLGQGGMGTVYQAEDVNLGRKVAIKILNPNLTEQGGKELERFRSEAKVQASLNNPNIVTLHDFEPYGNSYYMVMEFVEGRTLAEVVRAAGALPASIVVTISKQVLEGLSAAHRHGVVHRDLKPSNIMLTSEGVAKVMDFGIAKVQGGKSLTATGALVGTVYYMSPEQVRGETVDVRSDIYSFGIILFELLTGRVPFKEESDFKIMIHHVQTPPPPPTQLLPDIPTALEDVVLRCLNKDPDERFQNADAILAALESFEEQERAQGRGQLYMRRALAQWLASPQGTAAGASAEAATVLDSAAPAPSSFAARPSPPSPPVPPVVTDAKTTGPTAPPVPPPLPVVAKEAVPAQPRKGLFVSIGVAVVVLGAVAAGYYFVRHRSTLTPTPAAGVTQAQTASSGTAPLSAPSTSGAGAGLSSDKPLSGTGATAPEQPPGLGSIGAPGQPVPARVESGPAPRPLTAGTPPGASPALPARERAAAATPASAPPTPAARPEAAAGRPAEQSRIAEAKPPQTFLIFLDLDQSGERLPLGTAHGRVAEILRQAGYQVASSGVSSAGVRAALDRRDLAEVRRLGIGYVVMGTAHASLESQTAYGTTYHSGNVQVSLELVRMSDGVVAATGSASAKSRGSANAGAALTEALLTATSEAAREMLRQFNP